MSSSPNRFKGRICVEIAKTHPELVVAAHNNVLRPRWMDEIDELLRAEKKINAIKLWRAETGLGLKEAKEAVERHAEELGL